MRRQRLGADAVRGAGRALIARYGGEELAVVLPDTAQQNAVRQAEQTRQAVRDLPITHGPHAIGITTSVGVARLGRHESVQA